MSAQVLKLSENSYVPKSEVGVSEFVAELDVVIDSVVALEDVSSACLDPDAAFTAASIRSRIPCSDDPCFCPQDISIATQSDANRIFFILVFFV